MNVTSCARIRPAERAVGGHIRFRANIWPLTGRPVGVTFCLSVPGLNIWPLVDRIEDPWTTRSRGPRHELPDGLDPVAYVERETLAAVPTFRMVATVEAPAAEVRRRMGEAALEIEPLGDDRCRITTGEDTLPWLAFALLRLDADFEVRDPPALRAYLQRLGERLTGSVASQPSGDGSREPRRTETGLDP